LSAQKTEKELAYLKDLYVAPDWGERVAELFDENVKLIAEGRMLYVEANTGGHALSIQEKLSDKVEFICVDESEEFVEIALAKANVMKREINFQQGFVDFLSFRDEEFDLVIGDGSFVRPNRISNMIEEMTRVAKEGATVALVLPTASSFGEFFSIFWEALLNADELEHSIDVENFITELPTVSDIEDLARSHGLSEINSIVKKEEFDFESGKEFLETPLVADFLLPVWFETLPQESHEKVKAEIIRVIDESRDEMDFALTVKATLIVGKKK
jgi:hypothetical protein